MSAVLRRGPEHPLEVIWLCTKCRLDHRPHPEPRRLRIEGDVAYVPLTKGYEAAIDAADAEWVGRWSWVAHGRPGNMYAARPLPRDENGRTKFIRLHREVIGAPATRLVDHADGDRMNNRRANLRLATAADNARHVSRWHNKHGRLGVRDFGRHGKFSYVIRADGKKYHGRGFDTVEEAAEARNAMARQLHGQFATEG